MKKQRKVFDLRVTETELFAITEAINARLYEPDSDASTVERSAWHGIIRKADHAIQAHYAGRRDS
jgi:hypothetical protein